MRLRSSRAASVRCIVDGARPEAAATSVKRKSAGGLVRDRLECAALRTRERGPHLHVVRIVLAHDAVERGVDGDCVQRVCVSESDVIPAPAREPLHVERHVLGGIENPLDGGVLGRRRWRAR